MPERSLSGCRVLILEDEYFLADDAARALRAAGASVVGPVPTLEGARKALERDGFDVALLDVKLRNELIYPIADLLRDKGTPFAFVTGYDRSFIPDRFADVPYRAKPHDAARLVPLVEGLRAAAS